MLTLTQMKKRATILQMCWDKIVINLSIYVELPKLTKINVKLLALISLILKIYRSSMKSSQTANNLSYNLSRTIIKILKVRPKLNSRRLIPKKPKKIIEKKIPNKCCLIFLNGNILFAAIRIIK